MATYRLLKRCRGAPPPGGFVPFDEWTPDQLTAHVQYMSIFADKPRESGELAAELSAAPGKDGQPIHEWLEVRPCLEAALPIRVEGSRPRVE